jgi:uncharacterized protein (TIGR01777 family)
MNVVVTGATGFIGRALVAQLVARGDAVTALTRGGATLAGATMVRAELEAHGSWYDALAGADAIVHLAGEPIGSGRWDARRKQVIRDSRVESTRTIVEAIAKLPEDARPRALITASGADYYPFALPPFDDDEVTETDPPADSFLGRVCSDWEREARAATPFGVRVVAMRTGLVLGGGGGALAKMTTPFKLFGGGRIGSGKQWVSWIHLDDAVAAYVAAIGDARYAGPLNLVAGSVRGKELATALGAALHRPSWLPVPAFAVRAAVGELADYLLNGRNVVPAKLDALGFAFAHRDLAGAVVTSV